MPEFDTPSIHNLVSYIVSVYQTGFQPNRSTVDNIFILHQMYEKCYEHNIELHNTFIEFNETFNSINRSTIIQADADSRENSEDGQRVAKTIYK